MTEKRYKLEQWTSSSLYYSFPNGNLHYSIEKVVKRVETDLNHLSEENEQLKADNNRLVNETAKIIAEHQKNVLDLIDKSLEKDKSDYEMTYEDYLNGRIEALEELKKELQND